MKLLTILLASTIWLSGCTSWGQRQISVERDSDSWRVLADSGTDISDRFAGNLTILESIDVFYFNLNGEGGAVTSSKGHEATVDAITEVGTMLEKGGNAARKGFAP